MKYHLGIKEGNVRELFKSASTPTQESHGSKYLCTIGPFKTRRGAIFMRDHGRNNPHCQTVSQAERIAAGQKYDIALRKWIKPAVK